LPVLSNHNLPTSQQSISTASQQHAPQTSRNTMAPRDIFNEIPEENLKNKKVIVEPPQWNKNISDGFFHF
jgi:hypothetical protein